MGVVRTRARAVRSVVAVWGAVAALLLGSIWAATASVDVSAPGVVARGVTTPLAQADRLAATKDLQVGMSFGGRLQWMTDRQRARALDHAVRLGVTWVRTDLTWAAAEPRRGVYNWSAFDRVVAAARARGLKVLAIPFAAPPWARRSTCVRKFACPPGRMADYASFVGRAAARYAPLGVHTWQIWNEPNIWLFWTRPSALAYSRMLARSADRIHAVDPDARVVFGGLAALAPQTGVIEARRFLRRVCSEGVCPKMDAFAYHPYTFPDLPSDPAYPDAPWSRIADAQSNFVRILNGFGLQRVPIWVTEFGAPTGGVGRATDGSIPLQAGVVDHVTERLQARIAWDSVPTAVVTPRVKMLVWYTDVDLPGLHGKEAHYGLRHADGTAKPAWTQLQAAVARFAPAG